MNKKNDIQVFITYYYIHINFIIILFKQSSDKRKN